MPSAEGTEPVPSLMAAAATAGIGVAGDVEEELWGMEAGPALRW